MPNHMTLPPIVPTRQGHLPVGDAHQLYFAEYGQAAAPAVVVLHGGPGSGCKPFMLEWFDLTQQRVVLFDQRGAGTSLPSGETANNRTCDLVEDIEHLRRHLRIGRWLVVGGSWGATLGVCYAGRYPHALRGLILRGVFLASQRELEWFFQSMRALVPDAWARLTAGWTAARKQSVLQSLTAMLQSVTLEEQEDAARRWGEYEEAVVQAMTGVRAPLPPFMDAWVTKYRLQSHYLSEGCFTSERSLFRCARRAAQVPTILLHGTHDWICPPENATRLARFMRHAELRWIANGTHVASDPAVREALRRAIQDLQHRQ